MKLPAVENLSSGVEPLQIKRLVIEKLLGFGVRGDENLKPSVEEEAVDDVCADATADAVGSFEEQERDSLGGEASGGG